MSPRDRAFVPMGLAKKTDSLVIKHTSQILPLHARSRSNSELEAAHLLKVSGILPILLKLFFFQFCWEIIDPAINGPDL